MTGVQPLLALLGRILIAAVFLWAGHEKVTAFDANVAYAAAAGMPFPQVAIVLGAIIELPGSVLLILGYRVRLVAFIMAGFAIVTALIFHRNFGNFEEMNNFMKDLSIAGGLLQIVVFGGGAYSLDARRR